MPAMSMKELETAHSWANLSWRVLRRCGRGGGYRSSRYSAIREWAFLLCFMIFRMVSSSFFMISPFRTRWWGVVFQTRLHTARFWSHAVSAFRTRVTGRFDNPHPWHPFWQNRHADSVNRTIGSGVWSPPRFLCSLFDSPSFVLSLNQGLPSTFENRKRSEVQRFRVQS